MVRLLELIKVWVGLLYWIRYGLMYRCFMWYWIYRLDVYDKVDKVPPVLYLVCIWHGQNRTHIFDEIEKCLFFISVVVGPFCLFWVKEMRGHPIIRVTLRMASYSAFLIRGIILT